MIVLTSQAAGFLREGMAVLATLDSDNSGAKGFRMSAIDEGTSSPACDEVVDSVAEDSSTLDLVLNRFGLGDVGCGASIRSSVDAEDSDESETTSL